MPANLPPEYFEVEKKLRTARTPQEKIDIYNKLISIIPKHKGTEKLIALYRAKIAKAKDEMSRRPAATRHAPLFKIEKQGAGQIVFIGPPNSGKSLLIKKLTGAEVEVADYPFTTRYPAPYMMPFENIRVQLIDTPPITEDYLESWMPELIKIADAVALVIDLSSSEAAEKTDTLKRILSGKKIELIAADQEVPPDKINQLKKSLLIANKADTVGAVNTFEEMNLLLSLPFDRIVVSALLEQGLEELRRKLFEILQVVRVYSKPPGKKPDLSSPFTLSRGSKVLDLARAVHKDFAEKLVYARIWNSSGLDGLRINRDYVLSDNDIVELHI